MYILYCLVDNIKMDHIIAARNIRAVSYTNKYSANGSSYKDLELGHKNSVVGCNSNVFGSKATRSGDIVLIISRDNKKIYITMGVLEKRLHNCKLWHDNGGELWLHNFSYKSLIPITEITSEIQIRINRYAEKHDCNAKNFLNSRFCSAKLRPIFIELYTYISSL